MIANYHHRKTNAGLSSANASEIKEKLAAIGATDMYEQAAPWIEERLERESRMVDVLVAEAKRALDTERERIMQSRREILSMMVINEVQNAALHALDVAQAPSPEPTLEQQREIYKAAVLAHAEALGVTVTPPAKFLHCFQRHTTVRLPKFTLKLDAFSGRDRRAKLQIVCDDASGAHAFSYVVRNAPMLSDHEEQKELDALECGYPDKVSINGMESSVSQCVDRLLQ